MSGVVPNAGEELLLGIGVGDDAQENFTLKLYTNDYTPVEGSVASDFTEASGGGYAAKTLTTTSWVISSSGGRALATYAKQTWTFTGALAGSAKVYGCFIVGATSTTIVYAERASADKQLTPANNDTYSVTPTLYGE